MANLKIFQSILLLNEEEAKSAAQYDAALSIKRTVELIVRVYNYQALTGKPIFKVNIIQKG